MSVRSATGQQLVDAVLAAGWSVVGSRGGAYQRPGLVNEGRVRAAIVVPLDEPAPEYEAMLSGAVRTLEGLMFDGRAAHRALHRIDPEVYR